MPEFQNRIEIGLPDDFDETEYNDWLYKLSEKNYSQQLIRREANMYKKQGNKEFYKIINTKNGTQGKTFERKQLAKLERNKLNAQLTDIGRKATFEIRRGKDHNNGAT